MRYGIFVLLLLLLLLTILSAVGQDCSDLSPANNAVNSDPTPIQENVTLAVQTLVIEHDITTISAYVSNPYPISKGPFMYYYKFKERTVNTNSWTVIACVQGNHTTDTKYRWEPNVPQAIECVVELYSSDRVFLANDTKVVNIAGPRDGLSVELRSHQSSSNEFPCCYSTGEVSFTARVTLPEDIKHVPEFKYWFSFGNDTVVFVNSTTQKLTTTHNYNEVCSVCVTRVFVIINPTPSHYYYYCNTTRSISVIEPVTINNSDISINSGKRLHKGHSAKLKMTSNGTLPVTVCWYLCQWYNDAENCTESHNWSSNETCISMTHSHSCKSKLPLDSSGQFVLFVVFKNNISSFEISHNLTVDSETPVGAVAGGAAALSLVCVMIVVLITSFFGYIQYQRYKNRHAETASFKFVILPPIDTRSCWACFKRSCHKKWYKLTGKRFHEGLVHKLSGNGEFSYSKSLVASVSYGTLLKSEKSQPDEDAQVVLREYVDGQYFDNEDNR